MALLEKAKEEKPPRKEETTRKLKGVSNRRKKDFGEFESPSEESITPFLEKVKMFYCRFYGVVKM